MALTNGGENKDQALTTEEVMYTEAVVEELRECVTNFEETKAAYFELIAFICVVLLYFVVILMQKDPNVAWQMESTIKNYMFTSDTNTADDNGIATFVPDVSAISTWLITVVAEGMF